MQRNKVYSLLMEQTTVIPNNSIQVLEETKLSDGNSKVGFKCLLQESNKKNGNQRVYTDNICESIVTQLSPKANNRNLLMEVDHPIEKFLI